MVEFNVKSTRMFYNNIDLFEKVLKTDIILVILLGVEMTLHPKDLKVKPTSIPFISSVLETNLVFFRKQFEKLF